MWREEKGKSQAHFARARVGKGILNKWGQLRLFRATNDFVLWYIFSGGSIGWCGVPFLHGTVKVYLRRDWMQACEGLVCGKFSILLLMVFRRTLYGQDDGS